MVEVAVNHTYFESTSKFYYLCGGAHGLCLPSGTPHCFFWTEITGMVPQSYSLGFVFGTSDETETGEKSSVLLLLKKKPPNQVGKYNGGGRALWARRELGSVCL